MMPFLESTEGAYGEDVIYLSGIHTTIIPNICIMWINHNNALQQIILACQESEREVGDVGLHCTSCGGPEGTGVVNKQMIVLFFYSFMYLLVLYH